MIYDKFLVITLTAENLMGKQIPASTKAILQDDVYRQLTESNELPDTLVEEMIKDFSWDLMARSPRRLASEEFQTDLDLATFLSALAERKAVITIPQYKKTRVSGHDANVRRIGEARFGPLTGLYANSETLTMGVNVTDMSAVLMDPTTGKETVGQPRKFALINHEGLWTNAWRKIEFRASAEENKFLTEKDVMDENSVFHPKHFLHPNRWQSMFSFNHLLMHVAYERLGVEASGIYAAVKQFHTKNPGQEGKEAYKKDLTESEGKKVAIEAKTMVVEFDHPTKWIFNQENNPGIPKNRDQAIEALARRNRIVFTIRPALNFVIRANEVAYCMNAQTEKRIAPWIKGAKWEEGYKPPRARLAWSRLVFFQPGVGEPAVSLRYKIGTKKTEISENEVST